MDTVFKLQVRPQRILTRKFTGDSVWKGKRLRFTLTWTLEIPKTDPLGAFMGYEKIGEEIEGCLARVNADGLLIWSYPQARSGSYYQHIIHGTPDLYNRVQTALSKTKYMDELREFVDRGEATTDEVIEA